MKLRDLEYLVASATAGNFSRAARSLGISTSTISRCVGRFEDELGLAVFERGHSGVRLTTGGKAVLLHARRAVAELEAVKFSGKQNGIGAVGEVRLGVRMPPIGEAMSSLLIGWRQNCANVLLSISEMNERDLAIALDERRLDAVLSPSRMLPPRVATLPVYSERLIAALPVDHPLVRHQEALTWQALRAETVLVQGWDESQAEREFLAPLIGGEASFRSHALSQQSISGARRSGLWRRDRHQEPDGSGVSWCRLPADRRTGCDSAAGSCVAAGDRGASRWSLRRLSA